MLDVGVLIFLTHILGLRSFLIFLGTCQSASYISSSHWLSMFKSFKFRNVSRISDKKLLELSELSTNAMCMKDKVCMFSWIAIILHFVYVPISSKWMGGGRWSHHASLSHASKKRPKKRKRSGHWMMYGKATNTMTPGLA